MKSENNLRERDKMKTNINRRNFIKQIGSSAAALTLTGCNNNFLSARKQHPKPNIIFILADDLGYGDLGCYGQTKIKTPNIDKMAADGIRFTQHYSGSTVCAPSRCCLMTGLHTGHSLIRGNGMVGNEGQPPLLPDTNNIAKILKSQGYKTALIGKWGLGNPGSTGEPNKQGFDHWFGHLCQLQAHFYYSHHLWRNGQKVILEKNKNNQKRQYSHDLFTEDALDFIKNNSKNPFFLYLPYTIPHAELIVPEDSLSQYKGKFPEKPYIGKHYCSQPTPRATSAAMISRMDRDVGKILSLLKKLGIDENTIVMFSSDNGPHEEGGADPDFFKSYGPLRGIKRDLYEGGIRVPLIARWPGKIKPGTTSNHISAFWDFLPTCCELANAKTPKDIDGISFLPSLLGRDDKQKKHEYLYWEFLERGKARAVRFANFKAVQKNIAKNPNSPIELYDLKTDLKEKHNIADKHPDLVAKTEKYFETAHIESEDWPFLKK